MLRRLLTAAALVAALGPAVASAQILTNPNGYANRNGYNDRGRRVVNQADREVERIQRLIAALRNDRKDYGGRKQRAIEYLQRAESELQAGMQRQRI